MMRCHVKWVWLAASLLTAGCATSATAPERAHTDLGGTAWQLIEFQGPDDKTLVPDDPNKYTIAFESDGSMSARIDCNRGRGTWTSPKRNQLYLSTLALTRAMCPPAPLSERLLRDWALVRSYTINQGHLILALRADSGIYEFAPVSAQ